MREVLRESISRNWMPLSLVTNCACALPGIGQEILEGGERKCPEKQRFWDEHLMPVSKELQYCTVCYLWKIIYNILMFGTISKEK